MLRMGRQNPKPEPAPAENENTGDKMSQQPQSQFNPNQAGNQFNSSPAAPNNSSASPQPAQPNNQPPAANMGNGSSSSTGRPMTETESLARDIKEGALSGFVGGGTTMSGELAFKAMLRVDGHLSGRVSSADGTLIVSAGGQVDADIDVAIAQINGTVNGDVIASKRIELGRVAKVTGNIQTPALVVEQGAVFEGNCRMTHLQAPIETKPNTPAPNASANNKPAASPNGANANTNGSSSNANNSVSNGNASTGLPASAVASPAVPADVKAPAAATINGSNTNIK